MALSNIFREPRREIIETVIGLAIVGSIAWLDYLFGLWLQNYTRENGDAVPWPLGMLVGLLIAPAIVLVLVFIHEIGDSMCNVFERRGIHLRPRTRY